MELDTINEFIFTKHNIIPGTQLNSIEDIARNHLGLHAARIGSPYTTLCSRLAQFKTSELTNKLYKEKTLVKFRCMRTTLHIAPHDIAPILFQASRNHRLIECNSFFKQNNIPLSSLYELENIIVSKINDKALPASEIEETIIEETRNRIGQEIKIVYAKKVLKYFWENGILSYFNAARDWEKEDRKYVLTKSFYPQLNLEKFQIEEAKELLIIENIKKYGPVTLKDISWWSGLGLNIIKRVIEKNNSEITKFKIQNFDSEFYITNEEYCKLIANKKLDFEWISLLAFEDPSLKGYHESRFRYVDNKYLKQLLNQIGEVQASVIHNGKAIGIWTWHKKNKKIEINYFFPQSTSIQMKINKEKERYEHILFSNNQINLFNESEFLF